MKTKLAYNDTLFFFFFVENNDCTSISLIILLRILPTFYGTQFSNFPTFYGKKETWRGDLFDYIG